MANGEATALTPVGARQVVAEQADDDGLWFGATIAW